MTLDTLIMMFGALVAILPFLGFPNSWDTVMFVILGACIVALGIVVRRRTPRQNTRERDAHFVEHVPERSGEASHGEE
jgi:hypothetical protein